VLRDRPALSRWSRGRATVVGDAAHPTSPYAAYGAGMAIEDGYYLGRALAGVALSDEGALASSLAAWEEPRRAHTRMQVTQAWVLGKVFHHAPALLAPLRDTLLDHTPLLQKAVGDRSPGEIVAQLEQMDAAEHRFRSARPTGWVDPPGTGGRHR
jgi:2-polyprenyl-6-methoxyphenol hydroxylase-like FAD-dependent oxidoreductase